MKWSAIGNVVANIASTIISYVGTFFMPTIGVGLVTSTLTRSGLVGSFFGDIFFGILWGLLFGWLIAKFYPTIMNFQRKYLGNKLNTLFKLLFYPAVLISAIGIFGSMAAVSILGGFLIFAFIGAIVNAYIYATVLSTKVGKYYQTH